jgi:ABC-type dipeptide/oligopeptide/nickel transport system permease component
MLTFIIKRLIQSILILLGVSFITFALLYLLPADPVRQIAGRSATPETVANIRAQLGLDQPFIYNTHAIWEIFFRAILAALTCKRPKSAR